jgi:hypothetical protein
MAKNIKTTDDVYNVDNYTDKELYDILGLNNPSDRELEAKIFQLAKKYKNMDNVSGNKLAVFFENIYDRFFEIEDNVEVEGFDDPVTMATQPKSNTPSQSVSKISTNQLNYSKDYINPILKQTITRIISIDSQYRSNKQSTLATNFSFNLSESLLVKL